MGGYSIDISLDPAARHKASVPAAQRAAALLKDWLGCRLDELRSADSVFGEQLASYVRMVEPFRVTPTSIVLMFSDCGGEGYVSMQAAVHCIHRWLDAERDVVKELLAPANVVPEWAFDGESLGIFATARKQIVHLTDEWQRDDEDREDLGAEVDGDPYTVAVTELPMNDRKRLKDAWRRGACLCPVCRTLGPWRPSATTDRGGPLLAAVRTNLDPEKSGYSIASDGSDVVLMRQRRVRRDSFTETIAVVRSNGAVSIELSCKATSGCEHGVRVPTQQLGGIAFGAPSALAAWLTKHRAEIFKRSESLTNTFARQLAGKRAAHDSTYRIATQWWDERGKTLPKKQFELARVAGVKTFPALAELEALVTKRLRVRLNRVCLNAAWQDVIAHGDSKMVERYYGTSSPGT